MGFDIFCDLETSSRALDNKSARFVRTLETNRTRQTRLLRRVLESGKTYQTLYKRGSQIQAVFASVDLFKPYLQ